MPFDGGGFSRSPDPLPPGSLPFVEAPAPFRAWLARARAKLRALLPDDSGSGEHQQDDRVVTADSVARLLWAARTLVEAEANWTAGTYRTADGRYCAVGALRAAARDPQSGYGRRIRQEAHRLLLAVARGRGFDSVERMNDSSTHAEVLAAFDAAIMCAESRLPVAG